MDAVPLVHIAIPLHKRLPAASRFPRFPIFDIVEMRRANLYATATEQSHGSQDEQVTVTRDCQTILTRE
jgi:hypothetical protein